MISGESYKGIGLAPIDLSQIAASSEPTLMAIAMEQCAIPGTKVFLTIYPQTIGDVSP
jgi:hypothetical protein